MNTDRIMPDSDHLRFEKVWIDKNVNDKDSYKELSDDDRISFKIWEDAYWREMYQKHLPNTNVFRGNNPNIIFHGGCLGCKSQRVHGIDRCKGCSYFKYGGQNLFIPGEDSHKLSAEDFKNLLLGDENIEI